MKKNKLVGLTRKNDLVEGDNIVNSKLDDFLEDKLRTDEIIEYIKEANIGYQIFMNGLEYLYEQGNYSSKKYTDVLQSLIDDLRIQIKEATTIEEDERIWTNIHRLLDRMKEEVKRETDSKSKFLWTATTVGALAVGGVVTLVTKNPDFLKKGIETILEVEKS